MKILFDGIPLDKMSVSMTMNGAVLPVLAGYVVAAEEQGVSAGQAERHHPERHPQGVHGPQHLHLPARAVDADHRRHHRVHGAEHAEVQLDLDLRLPHAGSRRDQALELAFTLADGKEYVKTGIAKGMDVDAFAGRLSFFWAIGMNFYLEIAKMRAARLLWWRIMKGFNAEEARSPDAAHALPDLRLEPDRAGPVQQRRAHHHRGDGRGVRRHAVAAHQQRSTKPSRCRPSSRPASRATPSSSSRKRPTSPTWSTPGPAAT
jgi:hypothetical protein